MSKTKTPFFSMGAQGSVAGSITAQKLRRDTLIRGKPCPTDPYSLPQAYQRWLYQDYAYLWTKQNEATRRLYATYGTVYHLTAFQYWMKYHLKVMPDIVSWWRLDEGLGAIAYDQATDPHNGVIIGASPAAGVINRARFFDGLNDYVNIDPYPTGLFTAFTVLFFMNTPGFNGTWRAAIGWRDGIVTSVTQSMCLETGNTIYHWLYNTTGAAVATNAPHAVSTWELHGWTWDGTTMYAIRNSDLLNPQAIGGTFQPSCALQLGKRPTAALPYWYDGYLDNLIIYNRTLDATEIARWAGRSYPLQ